MTNCLGTRIKELRILHEMSQEELGRRVGVQRAAINKYEKGTVTNVPLQTVEQIAKVFDVSPTYLVGWEQEHLYPALSLEVKILAGVQRFYGPEAVQMMEVLSKVNRVGRKRLVQYAEEVSQLYANDTDE